MRGRDAEDAVISDALNHASIIDGIRLCKARRLRYANNDLNELEQALRQTLPELRGPFRGFDPAVISPGLGGVIAGFPNASHVRLGLDFMTNTNMNLEDNLGAATPGRRRPAYQ
jgi:hypothetical protein